MARKASPKSADAKAKKGPKRKAAGAKQGAAGSSKSTKRKAPETDTAADALIRLLQSPLVIDLLAVGATAAVAAITETRAGRRQGAAETSGKTIKAAGKAAAAAVGRRIATEFEEIRKASDAAKKTKAGKAA
jgi:hypothetical protein